jgi:hypothetical protein
MTEASGEVDPHRRVGLIPERTDEQVCLPAVRDALAVVVVPVRHWGCLVVADGTA